MNHLEPHHTNHALESLTQMSRLHLDAVLKVEEENLKEGALLDELSRKLEQVLNERPVLMQSKYTTD